MLVFRVSNCFCVCSLVIVVQNEVESEFSHLTKITIRSLQHKNPLYAIVRCSHSMYCYFTPTNFPNYATFLRFLSCSVTVTMNYSQCTWISHHPEKQQT